MTTPSPTVAPSAASAATASPSAAPGVLQPEAMDRLRELDPTGRNRLVERVVEAYRSSALRMVPQLRAAMLRRDLGEIRLVSHTLKSSSASIGATALAATCASVEAMARGGRMEGLEHGVDTLCEQVGEVLLALERLGDAQG